MREKKSCAIPTDTYKIGFKRMIRIVKIIWYDLSSIASTGDPIHEKCGDPQYIPFNTIVRSFTRDVTLVRTGLKYILSRDLDGHTCRFGDMIV